MLFNEFRLIGTVVSDFEEDGTMAFPKSKFMIEVEKKQKGKANTYPVIIHHNNNTIDISKSLKGSVVIVCGYVDVYNNWLSLVAQDVTVVGLTPKGKAKATEVVIKPEDNVAVEEKGGVNSVDLDEIGTGIPDDDLPF